MIDREVANWLAALPLLVMGAICLVWGADLIATEIMAIKPWWRLPLKSGAFYLGQAFVTLAVALIGLLGIFLLARPLETVPLWFAFWMAVGAVQISLAWWFFAHREDHEDERG